MLPYYNHSLINLLNSLMPNSLPSPDKIKYWLKLNLFLIANSQPTTENKQMNKYVTSQGHPKICPIYQLHPTTSITFLTCKILILYLIISSNHKCSYKLVISKGWCSSLHWKTLLSNRLFPHAPMLNICSQHSSSCSLFRQINYSSSKDQSIISTFEGLHYCLFPLFFFFVLN